eukprot:gene14579-30415_t
MLREVSPALIAGVDKMKAPELRRLCDLEGLPTTGTLVELRERWKERIHALADADDAAAAGGAAGAAAVAAVVADADDAAGAGLAAAEGAAPAVAAGDAVPVAAAAGGARVVKKRKYAKRPNRGRDEEALLAAQRLVANPDGADPEAVLAASLRCEEARMREDALLAPGYDADERAPPPL